MPYIINFTDPDRSITVEDRDLNQETSLTFPGNYTTDYGRVISENFLHLLENFAYENPPANPVEGQLWYDTNDADINQLKVFNGTQWVIAGGLNRSSQQPSRSASARGDLWVNLESQQLYLYNGSSWILVGPESSAELFTGVRVENIVDTKNQSNTVFTVRIANKIIAIYSSSEDAVGSGQFIPKTLIPGFTTIKKGINLPTDYRFVGVAEKSENLIVNGTAVAAGNFLRSDRVSTTNYRLNILSDAGMTIGANSQSSMLVNGNATVIRNVVPGSTFEVRMRREQTQGSRAVFKINSEGRVYVGTQEPSEASTKLAVTGNVEILPESALTNSTTGRIVVRSITESTGISEGSIVTSGGIGVARSVYVGEDVTVQGDINTQGNIIPSNSTKNIGTADKKFNQMHATTFIGNVTGNVTGTLSGRATLADRLTNSKTFSFSGDVEPVSIPFDGQNDVDIDLRFANTLIGDKILTTDSSNVDEILINKIDTDDPGLYRISKADFLKTVPVMPIGIISPYGGQTAPNGWLLCDGSEIDQSDYAELFNVIGHTFKPIDMLSDGGENLFGLPAVNVLNPYLSVNYIIYTGRMYDISD
jgi:hypothetical protein